ALDMGVKEWDVVEVKSSSYAVHLPVLVQPGQAVGTVAIALGYGRTRCGKAGNNVGKNAFPFANYANGTFSYSAQVRVTPTGGLIELAQTQTQHSMEGRDSLRESIFERYLEEHSAGSQPYHCHALLKMDGDPDKPYYSLWDEHPKPGHH